MFLGREIDDDDEEEDDDNDEGHQGNNDGDGNERGSRADRTALRPRPPRARANARAAVAERNGDDADAMLRRLAAQLAEALRTARQLDGLPVRMHQMERENARLFAEVGRLRAENDRLRSASEGASSAKRARPVAPAHEPALDAPPPLDDARLDPPLTRAAPRPLVPPPLPPLHLPPPADAKRRRVLPNTFQEEPSAAAAAGQHSAAGPLPALLLARRVALPPQPRPQPLQSMEALPQLDVWVVPSEATSPSASAEAAVGVEATAPLDLRRPPANGALPVPDIVDLSPAEDEAARMLIALNESPGSSPPPLVRLAQRPLPSTGSGIARVATAAPSPPPAQGSPRWYRDMRLPDNVDSPTQL